MRILSVTAQKPHSTGSGVYLTELVNNWAFLGHAQAVTAGVYREDGFDFPRGVAVYPVIFKSPQLPFAIAGMSDEMPYESTRYRDMTEPMCGQFGAAFEEALRRAVGEFQPDIIVCHHLYLLTALVRSWYPQKRVLGICHGSDLRQISKNPLEQGFIKEQIGRLNGVVALHAAQKKAIMDIYGLSAERIWVMGAGYNPNIFYEGKAKAPGGYQLVFAGKVAEKKGLFSLIRALDKLSCPADKLRLKIAGGSGAEEEYKRIRALAERSRYAIEFLGPLPQQRLADLFRESHAFVLPSFYEGLPLVVMEAMACGCHAICSDLPGLAPWFDENLPGHRVEFVELPPMENTDEPIAAALPAFEERLARAIEKKLGQAAPQRVTGLENVSWMGLGRRILKAME